jgi:hypothetical protein
MEEEDKNKIIQKLIDKGLCSIDADLVLNKAIEYESIHRYKTIEYYAEDLADLILQSTFIDKSNGEVKIKPFKLGIDYNTGKTMIEH